MCRWIVAFLSILGLALGTKSATGEPVTLLGFATVNRATIRLSDLLPATAPESLQQFAENVLLGKAPLPGEVREFSRQQLLHLLAQHPEGVQPISVPERIVVRRAAWPVERREVLRAVSRFLQEQGATENLSENSVRLPSGLTTGQENPAFAVDGSRRGPKPQTAYFFLHPVDRSAGGRFLVEVMGIQSQLHFPDPSHSLSQSTSIAASGSWLTQSGQRATLVLHSGEMRIVLPVTCLERGSLGQSVRVVDRARHRVFLAEITGDRSLRASF